MKIYKIASVDLSFSIPLNREDINRFKKENLYSSASINFYDNLGGIALVEAEGERAYIVYISSVPQNKKYTDEESQYKRRGWFKSVVYALQQFGFNTISVKMQSADSQKALARMYQNKIISNPSNFSGDSMAPYPSTFEIGGENRPLPQHEKDAYEQWRKTNKIAMMYPRVFEGKVIDDGWEVPPDSRLYYEAIKMKDGTIYYGSNHYAIINRFALLSPSNRPNIESFGFLEADGTYRIKSDDPEAYLKNRR